MVATAGDPVATVPQAYGGGSILIRHRSRWSWRRSYGRGLICAIIALSGFFALPDTASPGQGQKQVLVLYSTRRDAQLVIAGDRELPRTIDAGMPLGVDYYSEFLDPGRFSDPAYRLALRDYLLLKYQGHRFDIVLAMGDNAVRFIDEQRNALAPETPLVFYATSPLQRPDNSTGVIAELNFAGTLTLATQLQPEARQVFVVTGTAAGDKHYEDLARAQFRSFAPRLEVTFLSGLVTKDLESRLKTLPEHSFIYYLLVNRDGAGEYFHPLEYVDRLVAVANAPIYSWVDSTIGRGIVGGSLKDQNAQMQAVARLALRVLQGERPDAIPTSSLDLHVNQVDGRQLQRWGISAAGVPAGTVLRFREPTVWDRYKGYIIGALALLWAQTALIAFLLLQMRRRRQAEAQLRGNRARLRTSHERIRDLGARLLHAQETERARIARDLHDDITQQLVLLTFDLEMLDRSIPAKNRKWSSEALSRTQAITESVRDLSHRLHPARLRLAGVVPALDSLRREMSQPGLAITFTHENVPGVLAPDLTVCLFRVVQEALQNALKYSRAQNVAVNLIGVPQGLALTIVDDGVGFDVAAAWGEGLGLISMRERLQGVGGTFEIRSTPGSGTRVEVMVPVMILHRQETAPAPYVAPIRRRRASGGSRGL
jgi:signal transduction histidine kinase